MMKILITGASSGIGKVLYEHFRRFGNQVIGMSRRGPDVIVDLIDFGPNQEKDLLEMSPFDAVILNAGMMPKDEPNNLEALFALHVKANWRLLRLDGLVCPGGCYVVNASELGVTGCSEFPLYSASKAALINLVMSYSKILVPKGIRVNAFSCGFVDTPMNEGVADYLIQAIPMRRQARPEEIIPIVEALIRCTYITGQNIIVNGGGCLV